jgi:hypothetical protein
MPAPHVAQESGKISLATQFEMIDGLALAKQHRSAHYDSGVC